MNKLTLPGFYLVISTGLMSPLYVFAEETKIVSSENVKVFPTSFSPCLANVPKFTGDLSILDSSQYPVQIVANTLDGNVPVKAVYSGEVEIQQGNRSLKTNLATLVQNDKENKIYIDDNLVYQDETIQIKSSKGNLNLDNNDINLEDVQYHYVGKLGRGDSKTGTYTKDRYVILENGSFTSCPIGDNSWSVYGTKIEYDENEELIEINNALFKIGPVPIFYSPYFQIPTSSKRRTGFLKPSFSYDTVNGVDISLPFYWNIAPNYDLTFTPRMMFKRGLLLGNEFRYLNKVGSGTLALEWLPHDKLYNDPNRSKKRWLFYLNHHTQFDQYWSFNANVVRVSDDDYLKDITTEYASETDGYLTQMYKVNFNDEHWDINLFYRYFQSLNRGLDNTLYFATPQLNINYYDSLGPLDFNTFAQVSHFTTKGKYNPTAWRYHIAPKINYQYTHSWFSTNIEGSLLMTHYNQDIPDYSRNSHLSSSVNRVIPTFNIDSKITFERNLESGAYQTIEPRVKYIYTAYRDQSKINNYDSTLLQMNYFEMFRDRSYSGLDRIESANKIVMGVTSRYYDDYKVERFNVSIGQIYYFQAPKTGDMNSRLDQNTQKGSSSWAGDIYYLVDDDLIFRAGAQYDKRINKLALANATLEYRPEEKKMLQLSYRYASQDYIDNIGLGWNILPYDQDISQVGALATYPLTDTIMAVGKAYYDTERKTFAEASLGLSYSNCCWGMNIQYGRKIKDWDWTLKESEFENKLSLNFELRGLGSNTNPVPKMLEFGLLPYTSAF